MNRRQIYVPGEICKISGQYGLVQSNGRRTGVERGINAGDPFPPTEKSGQGYVLVDPTKTQKEDKMNNAKSEASDKPKQARRAGIGVEEEEKKLKDVLNWVTGIAVTKSAIAILLGVYFLYTGVRFLNSVISVTLNMKLFEMVKPAVMAVSEIFNRPDINSQIAYSLVSLISFLAVMIVVVSPGVLMFIGYKLLTREVFEKEMDKTGNLILRLRSGLGKVKPIEEMINSIFGRSRSAWDLQLWASRVTFFIGILILAVAVLQLLAPDLFGSKVDKAVFFGSGVGASVLTMAISYWLNPAEKLQKYLVQNADIELATISYVKQTELIDGWMTRALLSLQNDKDWGPENKVLSSLKDNTDILRKALENSVKTIDATNEALETQPSTANTTQTNTSQDGK